MSKLILDLPQEDISTSKTPVGNHLNRVIRQMSKIETHINILYYRNEKLIKENTQLKQKIKSNFWK